MTQRKVLLVIRDGYGERQETIDNAEKLARTPCNDRLLSTHPHCLLRTSGEDVGLPKGYMGGSEVGHITIGAGRIVWQNLELINRTIRDNSFFDNQAFCSLLDQAKQEGVNVHILGLLQDKGVHAHQEHLFALLQLCKLRDVPAEKVFIHIFSDGRDSPPRSLREYVEALTAAIERTGIGVIKTLVGRYFSMDRDTRWDRTERAYNLLVSAQGQRHPDVWDAVSSAYAAGEDDEFITPRVIGEYEGMRDDDVVLCYNYRTDRMRQLCKALLGEEVGLSPAPQPSLRLGVMTNYYHDINASVAFGGGVPKNTLGEVVSAHGLSQLRISETEKYPHVTFFFSGQREEPFPHEERVLIPSPRDVATYDEKPEMSIYEITDALEQELAKKHHSLIVVNFVNGDMVGHTGKLDAAIAACEAVDMCLERAVATASANDYDVLVIADHGNCEEMSGEHQTSHTLNDVDCILVSERFPSVAMRYGGLQDVAPTVLKLLELEQPKEMIGTSLF